MSETTEVNRAAFGQFLNQLRREKGWTQKDLAERLYVSDKAVSKWERGLSLPDVALLLPLAGALGVSVTELLEGRRAVQEQRYSAAEVEALIRRALAFPVEPPERQQARVKRSYTSSAACWAWQRRWRSGCWGWPPPRWGRPASCWAWGLA